jgi:hypothetical protein
LIVARVNGVRSLNADAVFYRGFRYPAEIISHCVWLYYRFPLSFREVEEMMLARGVVVSHETIRQWCAKFGAAYAAGLRRRRARAGAGDKWHLDEVFCECVVRRFRSGPLPGSAPVIRDGSEVFWPLRVRGVPWL